MRRSMIEVFVAARSSPMLTHRSSPKFWWTFRKRQAGKVDLSIDRGRGSASLFYSFNAFFVTGVLTFEEER
jgi:hypothetical protein